MVKTLIVSPHMDDEAISCGGLIQQRLAQGYEVLVMAVFGRVYDHGRTDGSREEYDDFLTAQAILRYQCHSAPLLREGEPGSVGFYSILERVEQVLGYFRPTEVVGPSSKDLNQDHRHLSHVLDIALRPINQGRVTRRLDFIGLDGTTQDPTYFIPLTEPMLQLKQAAIAAYVREMRGGTSPRSPENLRAQAQVWGAKCGHALAEAYHLRLIKEEIA